MRDLSPLRMVNPAEGTSVMTTIVTELEKKDGQQNDQDPEWIDVTQGDTEQDVTRRWNMVRLSRRTRHQH